MLQRVQVMMLAAGLGTRLHPLTADRGKPAVPFLGRPLVRGMLDWLIGHGAERIAVNTHHRPESIQAALADAPGGIELRFSHEPEILGTAGCLARALELGHLLPDRTTLVVNAKLVTGLDLSAALAAHRAAEAQVTMILRPNHAREAFTTVRMDGDRVRGFGPSRVPEGDAPLLFTGVHFLEPAVLSRAEPVFSDTVKDLYPPEIAARTVLGVVDEAPWAEFSTLDRYLDLQLEALGATSHVDPSARVSPDASVVRSVVGPGAVIEAGASLVDAVLWEEARVGAGAQMSRAVLGARAELAPGEVLERAVAVRPELAPQLEITGGLASVGLGAA